MKKTTDFAQLSAAMLNGTDVEVLEKAVFVCSGYVQTKCALHILLDCKVDESIKSLWEEFDELFGTAGFKYGDNCYYEYDDVAELNRYIESLFATVISPLVKFKKLEAAAQILLRLIAIATSMYGSGASSISGHIMDLAKLYWHHILKMEQPDTKCRDAAEKMFQDPDFKQYLEDYGYDDLYEELMDYSKSKTVAATSKSLGKAYVKKFRYKKPSYPIPEEREVLILCDDGIYLKGIDFKYLTQKQKESCKKHFEGNVCVCDSIKENIDLFVLPEDYEQMNGACRIFKKERIVEN